MGVRLSRGLNRSRDRVRSFLYNPKAHRGTPLLITLKYRAQRTVENDVANERTRMLSTPRHNTVQDNDEMNRQMEEYYASILAGNVVRIATSDNKPVTWRHLIPLANWDAEFISKNGGIDGEVPLDTTVNDNKLRDDGFENLVFMLTECLDLRRWVEAVSLDVGQFQDESFEAEIKNFGAGGQVSPAGVTTNSAQPSATSPATAAPA